MLSGLSVAAACVEWPLAMALMLPVLAILGSCAIGLGLVILWICSRFTAPMKESVRDPILGPKDRIAVYGSRELLIPMPDHLKTHHEMVAWMTKELPKLTAVHRNIEF